MSDLDRIRPAGFSVVLFDNSVNMNDNDHRIFSRHESNLGTRSGVISSEGNDAFAHLIDDDWNQG